RLHHPRPGDRLSDQRHDRRALSRIRGRGGRRGAGGQATSASVHTAAPVVDPAGQSRADLVTESAPAPAGPPDAIDTGCKFAARCPSVAPACREAPPPLVETDRGRAVACYLYRGAPVLTEDHP